MIDKDAVLAWLNKLNEVYTANRAYLTELDSPIGDADHGTNMARGFTKVVEKVGDSDKNIAGTLKDVGMTLVSTVGGSSGPLYGTFFMRFGMAAGEKDSIDAETLVAMFDAGLQGVLQRGKAQLEDKTMVDAMHPAVQAMKDAQAEGKTVPEILQAATAAAEAGMLATTPLVARKGRASYLGERSAGHQDPGATSTHLMFKAASDVWGEA